MVIGVKQSNALCNVKQVIYRMFFPVVSPGVSDEANVTTFDLRVTCPRHERLGHVDGRALCEMIKNGLVDGIKIKNARKFFCESCQLGKLHKLPFRVDQVRQDTKPVNSYTQTFVEKCRKNRLVMRVTMLPSTMPQVSVMFFEAQK